MVEDSSFHYGYHYYLYLVYGMVGVVHMGLELLWLCHHHLTELIKVHGSRTIFIKLLKNTLKFLFCERSKEFSNQSSKCLCSDVAKTLLVINPESILQFPLHGLHVRILYQECGTKLAELSKLNLTRAILINLRKKFFKLFLSRSEPHGSHDLSKIISRQEFNFLGVKQIKTNFQTLDLIWLQASVFCDLIKVDVSVGVSCVCHVGCVEAGGGVC